MCIEDRVLYEGRARIELVDGKSSILPPYLFAVGRDQVIDHPRHRSHLINGQDRVEKLVAQLSVLLRHSPPPVASLAQVRATRRDPLAYRGLDAASARAAALA